MGNTDSGADDAADLKNRAKKLREYAKDARSLARQLGPYLDDAVKRATPRADNPRGATGEAIWLGPFADESTQTLQQRQNTLSTMAGALMADASRWEKIADRLDEEATDKSKAKAGSH